jgi:hypothetical protein
VYAPQLGDDVAIVNAFGHFAVDMGSSAPRMRELDSMVRVGKGLFLELERTRVTAYLN